MGIPWWWVTCRKYKGDLLSRNVRNQIRQCYRSCSVRRVTSEWIAGLQPGSLPDFRQALLRAHEYPEVFHGFAGKDKSFLTLIGERKLFFPPMGTRKHTCPHIEKGCKTQEIVSKGFRTCQKASAVIKTSPQSSAENHGKSRLNINCHKQ